MGARKVASRAAMPTLKPRNRAAWRAWLAKNHDKHSGHYLIVAKKHLLEHKPGLLCYDDALDEALCFGWIDGHVRYFDEDWRAIRFTPRRKDSIWSERNKERVARLIRERRMTPAGQRLIDVAKKNGEWTAAARREELLEPPELLAALLAKRGAHDFWRTLPPSDRKQWIYWVCEAKRPETAARRIAAVVRECAAGRRPGGAVPATRKAPTSSGRR